MSEFQEWVPQALVQKLLMSVLEEHGKRYRKFQQILARPAEAGEIVVSITSSAVETWNTAREGDFVVQNLTEAMEIYIVSGSKFSKRYTLVGEEDDGWKRYRPHGDVFALEIKTEIMDLLERTSPFVIEAPWGEPQRVELNDFLVTLPDYSEIYRIARQEFFQTYRLVDDE
jgi:hypothetical protein